MTVAMSDELYADLLIYAADQSKRTLKKLSVGEAMRTLLAAELRSRGYEREELPLTASPKVH